MSSFRVIFFLKSLFWFNFCILCISDVGMGELVLLRTTLRSLFSSSAFRWVWGIKLRLPGLCGKCLYLLSHVVGPSLFTDWQSCPCQSVPGLWCVGWVLAVHYWLSFLVPGLKSWGALSCLDICDIPTPFLFMVFLSSVSLLTDFRIVFASGFLSNLCINFKRTGVLWNIFPSMNAVYEHDTYHLACLHVHFSQWTLYILWELH